MKHFTYEGTIINYFLFIQRKLTCLYLRQKYFIIQTPPSITFQYIKLNKNWIPYNLLPMSYSLRCPYHGRISSKKSFKYMLGSKRVPATRGMCGFQMTIRLFITHLVAWTSGSLAWLEVFSSALLLNGSIWFGLGSCNSETLQHWPQTNPCIWEMWLPKVQPLLGFSRWISECHIY